MSKLTQYGHSFQTKAIGILITDRDFLQQIADIVSPDYFDNDAGKWIIRKTLKYYNEYKTVPTMEVFKVELENLQQELQNVAVKDLLKQAYKASKATDLGFVKDTFLDFCKNQTLKGALMKSVDLLELGDYDDIRNLIDKALKAGTERDIGHEYLAELEDRFREEARNTVETPWPLINKLLCGGLGQGDLGLIAGGPGGGKSWALIALGAQAVKMGFTVIHYTLELSEKYVGRRYDACFTEIPVGDVIAVNTLRAHLEKCIQQNIEPDLIIVDYADLLTSKSSKEKRDKLDDIYTNLRGLASELKLPIWTASQVNRSGAREDIIQGDRMAESYSKMMITDFAMSLARSAEDKENGTGRWHIMKNRYGADGITYDSLMDTSIGKIEINMRGNNRPQQNNNEDLSPAQRRRLQNSSNEFFGF